MCYNTKIRRWTLDRNAAKILHHQETKVDPNTVRIIVKASMFVSGVTTMITAIVFVAKSQKTFESAFLALTLVTAGFITLLAS